jgi:hypothetical protein
MQVRKSAIDLLVTQRSHMMVKQEMIEEEEIMIEEEEIMIEEEDIIRLLIPI